MHGTIDTLITNSLTQKQKTRFIIVSDYQTLLAYDTKTTDTLDFRPFSETYKSEILSTKNVFRLSVIPLIEHIVQELRFTLIEDIG